MTEAKTQSKIDAAAKQAASEATAKAPAAKKAPAKKAPAQKKVTKKAPAKKAVTARKTAAKKAPAKKPVAKKAAPTTVSKLKDTIMAQAEKNDFAAKATAQAKELAADMQDRAKTTFAKAGEYASDANEFNKANLEAVVESGKILFGGAQEMIREDVATGKGLVETVTQDVKQVAAVKSPTELVQLQGEIARRNFDAAVSFGSQRTEALLKLYGEAFAPISNRVSVAAEKIKKAA